MAAMVAVSLAHRVNAHVINPCATLLRGAPPPEKFEVNSRTAKSSVRVRVFQASGVSRAALAHNKSRNKSQLIHKGAARERGGLLPPLTPPKVRNKTHSERTQKKPTRPSFVRRASGARNATARDGSHTQRKGNLLSQHHQQSLYITRVGRAHGVTRHTMDVCRTRHTRDEWVFLRRVFVNASRLTHAPDTHTHVMFIFIAGAIPTEL